MQITRLGVRDVERLGGPSAAARELRSLVPGGASVGDEVREILERVRREGEEAVLDYTRGLDLAGGEPRSEERRVGKECSLPCRSRWSPYH